MGYYIPGPNLGKAQMMEKEHGAVRLDGFSEAREYFAAGFGVVVVVNNGPFEAAGFAFSQQELEVFGDPKDMRPKVWFAMDRKKAAELSGYKERP